jgi:hypothetical protein
VVQNPNLSIKNQSVFKGVAIKIDKTRPPEVEG